MILSFAEAAKRAGVSRDTINRHARDGKFTSVKRGNGYKGIDLAEFERVYGAGYAAAKPAEVDAAQYDNELSELKRKTVQQEATIQALQQQIERQQQQIEKYIELTASRPVGLFNALGQRLLQWNRSTDSKK